MTDNRAAFLTMVAKSEGTADTGDSGYNVIVGSTPASPRLFPNLDDGTPDYSDHPRILVDLGHGLKSTAAGRYQVLERYFDAYKSMLNLPDFGHASQDIIALQQIKERKALNLIDTGNITAAIDNCSNIWASLPGHGNTYGQHTNSVDTLLGYYTDAGGTLADGQQPADA